MIMKLIHNLVIIDLKNEEEDILLANGINGFVDIVHRKERAIIEKWIQEDNIIPAGEEEERQETRHDDQRGIEDGHAHLL